MEETNNDENNLGVALVQSIGKTEILDLSQDFAEIALDSQLGDGIIKEIPVLKFLYSIGKTVISVRDYIFTQKIIRFLTELNSISQAEREELSKKIENDEKFQQRVGETLIMILDRFDHMDKPKLLAKLFRGHLRNDIDSEQFQRLSTAIDRIFIDDLLAMLKFFTKFTDKHKMRKVSWENLYMGGLSKIEVQFGSDRDRASVRAGSPIPITEYVVEYTYSENAEILARIILEDDFQKHNN